MKTIIEKVIGWDLKNKRPNMNKPGLFGIPEAFTHTTEEQGRRSLHGHFLIWIKGNDKINESLYSTNKFKDTLPWNMYAKKLTEQALVN